MNKKIRSILTLITCWGTAALIMVAAFAYFNNAGTPKPPIHVDSVVIN